MDKFKREFNQQQEFKQNVKYLKRIFSGPAAIEIGVERGGCAGLTFFIIVCVLLLLWVVGGTFYYFAA